MRCENCKFAEWEKTATGRLSRKGGGVCTWLKYVRTPPQFDGVTSVSLKGGYIWRNNQTYDCPVGAPITRHDAAKETTEQDGGQ